MAGPLNPPAGPVASSYKTLTQVEPRVEISLANTPGDSDCVFKITQPGSYYLSGNVTGASGKNGIKIAASDVSIDLNGFSVVGVAGTLSGITAGVGLTSISIANGGVRSWAQSGIVVDASASTIQNIRAVGNTQLGIRVGGSAVVKDCLSQQNGTGLACGEGSTVLHCSASVNTGNGIVLSNECAIATCASSLNGGDGISMGFLSSVTNCTASQNKGNGISGASSNVITGCSVSENTLDGIRMQFNCLITGNVCAFAGLGGDGAGIHVISNSNRIDGNHVNNCDRGIDVDGAANTIIRNTSTNCTVDYTIVANNRYGPIIDDTAVGTAAVNGSAAASTMGSTDPNANYSQ